ncbi:MAG: nucleotidyltransferase domain-containing protein [Bdellovibrionota bacterium]
MNWLEGIIGSRTRAKIFQLLFERADSELYLREIGRQSGLSVRPVQEELAKLLEIGLVKVRKDGNRVYYASNKEHPLYPEIHSLVEKTVGFYAMLQSALKDPDIKIAFIYGSVASGKARPDSDLDLFVIGKLGLRKLSTLLSGMSDRIGRLVNPHVMTPEEWARKIKEKNHFITNLIESEKIFIIGDDNELKRLGKK